MAKSGSRGRLAETTVGSYRDAISITLGYFDPEDGCCVVAAVSAN
jgi:hypothetical protein